MNDRQALLRAICREPADDTARLVYADYLDEQGEHDRAEFIRVQVAIANLTEADYDLYHHQSCDPTLVGCGRKGKRFGNCRARSLRLRERQLFGHPVDRPLGRMCPPGLNEACFAGEYSRDIYGNGLGFLRGFAWRWRCDLVRFAAAAKVLFAVEPVVRVDLTDRWPRHCRISGTWTWGFRGPIDIERGSSSTLPAHLARPLLSHPLNRMSRDSGLYFESETDAVTAASEVAVNWARPLCDLPPLPLTQPNPERVA